MLHRYPSLDWQDCPVAFRLRGLARPVVSVKIPLVFAPGDMPYMEVATLKVGTPSQNTAPVVRQLVTGRRFVPSRTFR
jgi:hypothetical protein